MKILTLAVNTLLMGAFGLAAGLSQYKLNNTFAYPDAYEGMPELPAASSIALEIQWVYWVMPPAWLLISILAFATFHNDDQRLASAVQLHTSVTLLVGVVMLAFFVLAGVMPFVSIAFRLH